MSVSPRSAVRALGRTGECPTARRQGNATDRSAFTYSHLYALYCLLQREREAIGKGEASLDDDERPTSPTSTTSSGSNAREKPPLPVIFTDHGWHLLNRSILSTSNCGNPALRLFGFGPVAADGYGIGYIIKDEGISV